MKKYLFIILVVAFSTSCEDLLKDEIYGVYSNENFFQSEDDALSALLYAYDPLNYIEYGSRFMFDMFSASTDEMLSYGKSESDYRIEMFNWTLTPSNTIITGYFKYCYLSIARANSVIQNVPNITNITDAVQDQYMGEAYFLRAFSYFNLVRAYGECPLRTTVVSDIDEVNIESSSIKDIYSLIISDLEEGVELMSIRKMQGRADKVAAQSLLAKVYATLASSKITGAAGYDWVNDAEGMYAESARHSGYVVNNQSEYALDPDLLGMYDVNNLESSPEHIFLLSQKRFLSGQESNFSQIPQMFVISLPLVYVNDKLDGSGTVYPMVNNQSWGVFKTDSNFYKSFDNTDLRKELFVSKIYSENGTLLAEYSSQNITNENQVLSAFYYPFCRKYSDPDSDGTKTSANPYFLRFADVALLYAEAEGNTEQGYYWINQVRNRADLGDLTPGLSLSDFREAVWEERKFELAFEGQRLFELRRTNRVISEIKSKTVNPDYADFFPIPQREVDLNP